MFILKNTQLRAVQRICRKLNYNFLSNVAVAVGTV